MATGPQPGDLIIRNTVNQRFDVFGADGHHVAGPFESFVTAHVYARVEAKGGAVWQQAVDLRGRLLGDPTLVPLTPHRPSRGDRGDKSLQSLADSPCDSLQR